MCTGTHNPHGTNSADKRDSIYCAKPKNGDSFQKFAATYPSISFSLAGNVNLCIPAAYYFFKSDNGVYCVGFFKDPDFVFGANLMNNYNVIFDHENNRVGWARAKCEDTATSEIPCCGGPCRFGTTTKPSGTTTPIAAAVSTSSATTSSSATSTPWPILYTSTSSGTVIENASISIFANSSQVNGTTNTATVHDPAKERTATKGALDWFSSMS